MTSNDFVSIIDNLTYEQLKEPSGDLNRYGHSMPLWLRIVDTAMCNIDLSGDQPGKRFRTEREDGEWLAERIFLSVIEHIREMIGDLGRISEADTDDIIILRKLVECFQGCDDLAIQYYVAYAEEAVSNFDREWPLALSHYQH